MSARLALVLVLASGLLGCSGDPDPLTQIQVTVDSDLDVPGELDRVTIAVTGMVTDEAASADLRAQPLPRRLTLVHEGGPLGPLRVTATGFHGRTRVVERVVQTRFKAGELVELAIELQRECVQVSCPSGFSCEDAECRSIANGRPLDGGQDDGGQDGGGDGGDVDAGPDAGSDAGSDAGADAGNDGGSDAGDAGDAATNNQPPACTISAPLAGATLTAGQDVRLEGHCDDPERGRVRAADLSWTSLQEGALCSGAMCDAALSMPVAQTLSLCTPDPDAPNDAALRGCATVAVSVALPPAPTVSIDSVTQSGSSAQPFSTGATIVLMGNADGQEVTVQWRDTLVGAFGTNPNQASLSNPMIGRHTVTLSATDNVGQMRQASVTFVVLAANAQRLVQPFAIANTALASGGGAAIHALARDSADHGLFANGLPAVYMVDGTADPALAGISAELTAPALPANVRAIALAEGDARSYFATGDGLVVCDYAASTGIGNSCSTFHNGNFPSDDLSAVVRARADGTDYLVLGTRQGLLATTNVNGANTGQTAFDNVAITGLAAIDDAVWVATGSDGLWRYELANDRARGVDGGPSDQLTAAALDAQGAVWVGSNEGVGRYDPTRDNWLVLRSDASPAPHLLSDTVRCVATTRTLIGGTPHDVLWVGTDMGVTRIDATIGTVMNLTEDDGLPNDSVRAIVVLSDGTKLFATDSGLARYAGP